MKLFSEAHKTVFVVDHCPYMGESCRQTVEFDMFTKNRAPGIIPLAPIAKSLWTCAVESAMEYCRIMYDVFPARKLVRGAAGRGVVVVGSRKRRSRIRGLRVRGWDERGSRIGVGGLGWGVMGIKDEGVGEGGLG